MSIEEDQGGGKRRKRKRHENRDKVSLQRMDDKRNRSTDATVLGIRTRRQKKHKDKGETGDGR